MASAYSHPLHFLASQQSRSFKQPRNLSCTLNLHVRKPRVSKFSVSTIGTTFSSVGVPNGPNPLPFPRPPNYPLFWIGLGIGFSSLVSLGFSWGSHWISCWVASSPSSSPQKYAWKAFKNIVSGKASGSEKGLSVDALETMFNDPTVQELLYPHLPEHMRDPKAVTWMLHNTSFCQQLQEMLDAGEWDDAILEALQVFDISSPEVRQLLDEMKIVPEQLVANIMASPDVAEALRNPKVQKLIIDYYTKEKRMDREKYKTDNEVVKVWDKLQELFP